MLLVDIFVLRDYFSGRSYRIFRAPLPCGAPLAGLNNNFDSSDGDVDLAMLPGGWCPDVGPAGPDARYFYGVTRARGLQPGAKNATFCAIYI